MNTAADDIVAIVVTFSRIKCVPSNSQPNKPASWIESRIEIDKLAFEPAWQSLEIKLTPAIQKLITRFAANLLAIENGQPDNLPPVEISEIDEVIARSRRANVLAAERSEARALEIAAQRELKIRQATEERDRLFAARSVERKREDEAKRREMEEMRNARIIGKVPVHGNTFAAKDRLRIECGATWDGLQKAWLVPSDQLEKANKIVLELTPKPVARQHTARTIAQFWEPCNRCGNEPTYEWSDGEFCCDRCHS